MRPSDLVVTGLTIDTGLFLLKKADVVPTFLLVPVLGPFCMSTLLVGAAVYEQADRGLVFGDPHSWGEGVPFLDYNA